MEIIPRLGGNYFFVQAGRQHGRQRVESEANSSVVNIASCTKWNGLNVSFWPNAAIWLYQIPPLPLKTGSVVRRLGLHMLAGVAE